MKTAALLTFPGAEAEVAGAPRAVRLERLTLTNFRAVRAASYGFAAGADATVYGANGTGKTTLADAWYWLLTGKDSAARADAAVKTLAVTGEAVHDLDHTVEAIISTAAGTVTLSRTLTERWTKRRGSPQAEFAGHTTAYAVDGVPVSEREFGERVAALLAPEPQIRLLSDPAEFAARLHWQERRKLLLEVCGDATEAEVLASDPWLAALPQLRGTHTLDEFRAIAAASLKKANAELDVLPARLDATQRTMPASAPDAATAAGAEQAAAQGLAEARGHLQTLEASGPEAVARAALAAARAELSRLAEARQRADREAVHDRERQLRDAAEALDAAQRRLRPAEAEHTRLLVSIAELERQVDAKLADWHRRHDEPLAVAPVAGACAACGQALPAAQVEAARAKAQQNANLARAHDLAVIQGAGKAARATLEAERGRLAMTLDELRHLGAAATQAREALAHLQAAAPAAAVPGAAEAEAQARVAELELSLAADPGEVRRHALAGARAVVAATEAILAAAQRQVAEAAAAERIRGLVEELTLRQRSLAAEAETLLAHLDLCDRYTVARVNLLEGRIARRFPTARWKLFHRQINGGLAECCELTIAGVPYADANHAARVNVGLECISVLQGHFGVSLPVWVDQRESVSHLAPVPAQVISLVVSEADRTLRIAAAREE